MTGADTPDVPAGRYEARRRPRHRRWPSRLLGLTLVVSTLLWLAGPASAAPPVPFDPAQPTVFIAQGVPTQLDQAQQSNGAISFTPVGVPTPGVTYNAIGYDTCNNFIYGVQSTTANSGKVGDIIQIASDGSISYTGINVGSGFNVGAFGPDANCDAFYVGQSGASTIDVVNLAAKTFTTINVGAAGPDITYSNGFFWSMPAPNQIQRINVTPGQLGTTLFTNVSTPPVGGSTPTGIFGGGWTYGNGNVGFSNNNSGNIYEIAIANASSSSPTFTTVLSQTGPASSNNDGTNAPGLSTDLAVTKSATPTMVDPGGKITYTLTVTNNGPGNSSGYALNDTLPPGVSNLSSPTAGCRVTGQTVSCAGNPLAAGASATATITASAPNPFTGQLTNTAVVTPNENDPNPANNTASATVTANVVTVSIVKSAVVTPASDQHAAKVGDAIQYAYTITNTGNVPLPSVAVSDATAGPVTCPVPAAPGLAPGASETCTAAAPYLVRQADVDAGNVTDSATATGTDATGFTSSPSAPSTVTVPTVAAAPALSMRKVADASLGDSTPVQVGETILYSYVVTNTGNVDLGSLAVSDPTAGAVSCPAPAGLGLAPGQSETCTANSPYVVTQSDVDGNGVTDTAAATGTDAQGMTATSQPANVHIPSSPNPAVSIDKSAVVTPSSDQSAVAVGDSIQYAYKVTNSGNVTLSSVAVDDPSAPSVSCPTPAAPGLGPGAAETCTASGAHRVTQADVDAGGVTDTATATGTDTQGHTSSPSNPSTVTVPAVAAAPLVTIVKSATVSPAADQTGVQLADTIHYSYKVANSGNVTLVSVAVDDPTDGGVTCPTPAPPGLAPGASETCTADSPHTVTQSDVDAGAVIDTATATGTDIQGVQSAPSPPTRVSVPAIAPSPSVSISKRATVSPAADQGGVRVGDTIQYSYQVTNTGNVTLSSVAVDDLSAGSVSCPSPAAPGLAPHASEICVADHPYIVTQADIDAGRVADSATATGTDTHGDLSGPSAPSQVTVPATPALPSVSVVKTPNAADGDLTTISPGEQIGYSYLVTNTGNVDLVKVSVADDKVATVTCPTPPPPGLAPGQSETCTGTYTVTAQDALNNSVTNSATTTGIDTTGTTSPASSASSATVPSRSPAAAVAIDKRAVVTPSSDQGGVQVGDHISYSYVVTNTGNVNLSSVSVADPTAGGVTCPALPAPGLTPGASVTCSEDVAYQVTQADLDNGSVHDSATATGSASVNGTTLRSPSSAPASVTVPAASRPGVSVVKSATVSPPAHQGGVQVGDSIQYSYLVTNTGNVTLKSLSVDDPTAGTVTCPAPAAPGLAPGAAETCTAAHPVTVGQADVDAGQVTDTASATGTDLQGLTSPPASASATVLAEPAVPSLSLAKQATVTPASDQDSIKVGDSIRYGYTVVNTGNVTLSTVAVTDPTFGPVTCPVPASPGLAPGGAETCTATGSHTVTQADIDAGGVTDQASATGSDTHGSLTPTSEVSVTTPATRTPRVSLVKSATVTPVADQNAAQPGDSIAYSFAVTNTGNVDLPSISVSDPSLGEVSCPIPAPPGLAPGAAETCTGELEHVVTAADQAAGQVTDSATATGVDGAGQASPAASSTATVNVAAVPSPPTPHPTPPAPTPPPPAPGPSPRPQPSPSPGAATTLTVHKQVNLATAYPGQKLTYTLTVKNPGPDPAPDVTVTDTPTLALKVVSVDADRNRCRITRSITCTLGTLAVGRTVKIVIVAEVRESGVERNTATARTAIRLLDSRGATSTATTRVTPILRVRKAALTKRASTGQNVTYAITVTNPTLVAIRRIAVCDALPTPLLYLEASPSADMRTGQPCWRIARLAAGRSRHFTVVVNVAPGKGGRLVNRARATAPGVRAGYAAAGVSVTQLPEAPCAVSSRASAAAGPGGNRGHPIARAAC